MSVSAITGSFLIAPQANKGTLGTNWKRMRVLQTDYDSIDMAGELPPEIGGTPFATGGFKAGTVLTGGATFTPRLSGMLGYLLYAATGSVSKVTSYGGESGVYAYVFTPKADDKTFLPWLSAMKFVPGSDGTESLAIIGRDNRMTMLEMTIPPAAPVAMRFALQGIYPELDDNPDFSGTGYNPAAYDDSTTVPLGSKGTFKVNDVAQKALGATVTIANQLTGPREEQVLGSYFLDDIMAVRRGAAVRWVYKWSNPDLHQQIFGGSSSATEWTPTPFYAPVESRVESPGLIPSKLQPYSLTFKAARIRHQPDGGPMMEAGRPIAQSYVGTVEVPLDESDEFQFILVTDENAYTWS